MRHYYDDDACRDGCGRLIGTDGDLKTGRCVACQAKADKRNARSRENRAAMQAALDSVGMRRVRGNLGGVHYE